MEYRKYTTLLEHPKHMSYNSIVSKYYIVLADFIINIIGASHYVL